MISQRAIAILILITAPCSLVLAQQGPANAEQAAPLPTPRTAAGRVSLRGTVPGTNGIWLPPPVGTPGTGTPVEEIPFQPWAKALYEERVILRLEPHARCKASGAARQFLTPYGVEFVEIPELSSLYILDIGGPHSFRTVHMDGRTHPANPSPSNYGHSIGWWEGDTLVVDTVGYNEDFWFDRYGLPHTESLQTVERFVRVNHDVMEYELTVEDPGAYTGQFTMAFELYFRSDEELFEYVCQQSNFADELMVGTEQTRTIDRSTRIVP
ncbi:MAG TPA: hypothetical protein VIV64_04265 [Gammaproteobacteria bacterium]|jgi:hypothetical protein